MAPPEHTVFMRVCEHFKTFFKNKSFFLLSVQKNSLLLQYEKRN